MYLMLARVVSLSNCFGILLIVTKAGKKCAMSWSICAGWKGWCEWWRSGEECMLS